MVSSSNPAEDFFVYDSTAKAFFHFFLRSDWKIAVISFDELKKQVNTSFQNCGAELAKPPHIPTEAEKKAMTDVWQLIQEMVRLPKYQFESHFDPKYQGSQFHQCFSKNMTTWYDQWQKNQSSADVKDLIGIIAFVVATVLLVVGSVALYRKWRQSSSFGPEESGDRLFSFSNRSGYQKLDEDFGNKQSFDNSNL